MVDRLMPVVRSLIEAAEERGIQRFLGGLVVAPPNDRVTCAEAVDRLVETTEERGIQRFLADGGDR